jgi:hypothetical protein
LKGFSEKIGASERGPSLVLQQHKKGVALSNEKQDKVQITLLADQDLEQMAREINHGFTGGRVNKVQLLSWLVSNFRLHHFRAALPAIRSHHFDELAHLKSVVKELEQARRDGNSSLKLSELLQPIVSRRKVEPKSKVVKPAPLAPKSDLE